MNRQSWLYIQILILLHACITAKSTSRVAYILKTGKARYPLLWSLKKQSSTARSPPEAELIASSRKQSSDLHAMIESLVGMHAPRIVFEQDNHCNDLKLLSETATLWPRAARQRCAHSRAAGTRRFHYEVL